MTIACLGWGSLIWSHGSLPIKGAWQDDGPLMPIEFARQSGDGRITLVITPGALPIRVLWVPLNIATGEAARVALAERENVPPTSRDRAIGFWNASDNQSGSTLAEWATKRSITSVVWTALGPKIGDTRRTPTIAEVIEYLGGLDGDLKDKAEEYVRRAPEQVATIYRAQIEAALGWTPIRAE